MEDENPTSPAPLVRGEQNTPSPDKGRVGEGLGFHSYDKRLTKLARENRKNPTPAEALIWQKVLRSKQLDHYKFHRQKPIGPYIVDFYCSELHLVIEIDGDSHAEQAGYDALRTAYLNNIGLRILRYANREVLGNLPGIFDDLSTHIQNKQS